MHCSTSGNLLLLPPLFTCSTHCFLQALFFRCWPSGLRFVVPLGFDQRSVQCPISC
jgi:hypothetical protein